MTTVQMHYFIVAAEHLNFTMAAEQLYITQPALSRQIAAIEDEIGAKLFSRCNNVLSLTKAGRVLLHQLSGLYSDYQNVIKNVRDVAAGIEGHINIGVLEDQYMDASLSAAIRRLIQNNPLCEINITRHDSSSLFAGLIEGTVDAGVMLVYDEFDHFGFASLPLDIAPARLAIHRDHPCACRESLSYSDLDKILNDIPLVMADLSQFPEPLQNSLLRFPPFAGLGPKTGQLKLLSAISSVSLYVALGLGVTLSNRGNLLANDPNVVMLPVKGIPSITQGLVWRKNYSNPLLSQLVTLLEKYL